MNKSALLVLCVAGPLLGACAVGPDYMSPSMSLPAQWSANNKVPFNLSNWWHNFNDPLLDALISEAVVRNLDVAAAQARIRESRASRSQAVGALFPTLSAAKSAKEVQSRSATGRGDTSISSQFQAGFDASWELDLFGANRRSVEAADYGIDAAEDDLRATLLTLIGDVASTYIDARAFQARTALARQTAATQRKTAALIKRKQDAGTASAIDSDKAIALAASTEASIPTYESSYQQAIHRLGVLLGRDPNALAEKLAKATSIPTAIRPLPSGIPANVLSTRPDVRKAERLLAQYTAKIGQAEAALYPDVSLSGSVSTNAMKLGDIGRNSTIGWSIGPMVSVPIFNGGKLRAAVDVAEAQRDERYYAWKRAVLNALEDVENAIVSLGQEKRRFRSLTDSAEHSRKAAQLARSIYESGSSTFLDVLDAERSQLSAEESLLSSRAALAKYYVALAKALGGGWNGELKSKDHGVSDGQRGPRLALGR